MLSGFSVSKAELYSCNMIERIEIGEDSGWRVTYRK